MNSMKDIDSLLKEAETGKQSQVFSRITEEAMPFWQGCEDRIKSGHKLKPYVVHRLLREEYDIKIKYRLMDLFQRLVSTYYGTDLFFRFS